MTGFGRFLPHALQHSCIVQGISPKGSERQNPTQSGPSKHSYSNVRMKGSPGRQLEGDIGRLAIVGTEALTRLDSGSCLTAPVLSASPRVIFFIGSCASLACWSISQTRCQCGYAPHLHRFPYRHRRSRGKLVLSLTLRSAGRCQRQRDARSPLGGAGRYADPAETRGVRGRPSPSGPTGHRSGRRHPSFASAAFASAT